MGPGPSGPPPPALMVNNAEQRPPRWRPENVCGFCARGHRIPPLSPVSPRPPPRLWRMVDGDIPHDLCSE